MIGEHSWITFLCCQCRCQIFKGERYFRTVFYYNFQTVLVAIVCLKAETSHYGAARGFYRPSLGSGGPPGPSWAPKWTQRWIL